VGTPVFATRDAVVTVTGNNALNGRYIRLRCADGYEMVYAHLSAVHVRAGESVEQGFTIGLSGNTGQSTGPHLHYGVYFDGNVIDPLPFVHLAFSDNASREYTRRNP
jgi:murein DD-endopeptidase MepM/ murein hydrolase activator NlpD